MKFLVFAVLLYFAYRLYIKPFLLSPEDAQKQRRLREKQDEKPATDDDYIDYEEVD